MRNNKLIIAMALTLSLSLVSCGDDESKVVKGSTKAAPVVAKVMQKQSSGIMDYIPANTPMLMVFTNDPEHPMPQNFMEKMDKIYANLGEFLKMTIEENMSQMASLKGDGEKDQTPKEVTEFIDKWLNEDGFKKLGISIGETEFAMYMVDLFPVLRMTLAKSHSMHELLDELVAKANESKPDTAIKRDVNGKTIYQFGDKEFQAMISLNGNTFVVSFSSSRDVDKLMPKLLGFEKPSKSLKQSNQYHDTVSKYNYLDNSLYWFNLRQLADYFVNPSNHDTAMLDILKIQDNMLSPDCKTEILQIFDKMPRLVGGSTLFDNHKMNSHMIMEMESGLGSKFAALSGRIPNANIDAELSYGFSFDIAAAKTLAQEFVANIETTPYKCEFMQGFNEKSTAFSAQLNQPMPPFVGNFKGFNIVLDELDLDFSKQDPNEMVKALKAKVLIAVDDPEAIQGMASMMLPELQKLGLVKGGDAVNITSLIPVQGSMLPINLDHVFLAIGEETIGLSLGEATDVVLVDSVAAESSNKLIDFRVSADMYKNMFSKMAEMQAKLLGGEKKKSDLQERFLTDMLWWNSQEGSINFTDRGFEVDIDINY